MGEGRQVKDPTGPAVGIGNDEFVCTVVISDLARATQG
ncbi:MAG: hypothetical protein QOF33_891, partial [Thermomicrobiales bacterium]|nr:hypothetical protein [Thermomicrobiales bacterium]